MGNTQIPLQTARESPKEELSSYSTPGPFWTEKPDVELITQYAKRGPASREMSPAITVVEMLSKAARKRPNSFALYQEPTSMIGLIDGKRAPPPVPREMWRKWTFLDYLTDVRKIARAMMSVGFLQHDSCTIFGFVSEVCNGKLEEN
jgi:hypothetical protein